MTLLGQSLGSMLLAWEAMYHVSPDVFIGIAYLLDVSDTCDELPASRYYGLRVHFHTHSVAESPSCDSPQHLEAR